MITTGEITMPPIGNTGNLVSLFEENIFDETQTDISQLLQLSSQLQTSLDIDSILTAFSEDIQSMVAHDHLGYGHEEQGITFSVGKSARHKLSYQLTVNDEDLGTLLISRRRKFKAEESRQLENLLCALLYPLRNALLYHSALTAAHKDPLTGIDNRAALNEVLDREIELAHRHQRPLGMIVIDIDHFKSINDTYGHSIGDSLLKAMANCAENTIRLSDQLFRYGGEEFVVLLPETDDKGVKRLADRIRRNVAEMDCACEGKHIKMTASFGVATLRKDEDGKALFARTDQALYQAKKDGRNCTRIAK
ncbi:MAG: GGDEF domain-containing protein [Gammaproteobacteria bacterium]|nr:GGDEF domain-containing protein [Gammaproteobacteria bacterium]